LEILVWAKRGERPALTRHRLELDPGIDDWVHKALAPNPDDRFSSVRSLFAPLETLLGNPPTTPY
jgi:hypothetical protein